jgi:hypothetical protein
MIAKKDFIATADRRINCIAGNCGPCGGEIKKRG